MGRTTIAFAACAACAAFFAACAETTPGGIGGPPRFCLEIGAGAAETCADPEALVATRTSTSGNTWFRVEGPLSLPSTDPLTGEATTEERAVVVFGQVPVDARFPATADNAVISVPVAATCAATHALNPFGACEEWTRATVCQAEAVYDREDAFVLVERLDDRGVSLRFSGTLDITILSDCCKDDSICRVIDQPAAADPPGPYLVEGRIRAAFGG